jgi:hypothetical protein
MTNTKSIKNFWADKELVGKMYAEDKSVIYVYVINDKNGYHVFFDNGFKTDDFETEGQAKVWVDMHYGHEGKNGFEYMCRK